MHACACSSPIFAERVGLTACGRISVRKTRESEESVGVVVKLKRVLLKTVNFQLAEVITALYDITGGQLSGQESKSRGLASVPGR